MEEKIVENTEDLTQVLGLINAKGDTGEIKEILDKKHSEASSELTTEGNDVLIL